MSADDNLKCILEDIPTFKFLGTPILIGSNEPYVIDAKVKLVCKYLKRFDKKTIDVLNVGK